MAPAARKFMAVVGVCLVFVVGMVAGGAVTLRVVRNRAANLLTDRGSDVATERLARRLADKLGCDASQRDRIVRIFREAHGEMKQVRRDVTPRVREIYLRAVAQIRGGLRSSQTEAFDQMAARQAENLHLNDGAPPASSPAGPAPGTADAAEPRQP